jgi:hypothetical protein
LTTIDEIYFHVGRHIAMLAPSAEMKAITLHGAGICPCQLHPPKSTRFASIGPAYRHADPPSAQAAQVTAIRSIGPAYRHAGLRSAQAAQTNEIRPM